VSTTPTTVPVEMRARPLPLGVGSGRGVTITPTLLQESEFHGVGKVNTCDDDWQTSAMLVSGEEGRQREEDGLEWAGGRETTDGGL